MSRPVLLCSLALLTIALLAPVTVVAAPDGDGAVNLVIDDGGGRLKIDIGGKDAVEYRYKDVDLPHFFPVKSPSGKLLTIEKTEPYPHHRSLWFADTVHLAGHRQASFYNALYTQVDKNDPTSPFRDHVRHVEFQSPGSSGRQAEYGEKLVWEMDLNVPVLDEVRHVRLVDLDNREYLLDLDFTLTATHGDVAFKSDVAHYAWPYVRMNPQFSVDKGGTLTNSEGQVNQKATNNQRARWVDYCNTVDGVTEGLAFLTHDQSEPAATWLTRDYGTFGVRRPDPQNGRPFALKKGESLHQRVGILVHKGDVRTGRVAERYRLFVDGKL
jgi:hypothetical protein